MQGTTTNGDYMLEFRKGAFLAGAPVQPVILDYGHVSVLPSGLVCKCCRGKIQCSSQRSSEAGPSLGPVCALSLTCQHTAYFIWPLVCAQLGPSP